MHLVGFITRKRTIFNSTVQDLLKDSRIVQLVKKFPVRFEVLTVLL